MVKVAAELLVTVCSLWVIGIIAAFPVAAIESIVNKTDFSVCVACQVLAVVSMAIDE